MPTSEKSAYRTVNKIRENVTDLQERYPYDMSAKWWFWRDGCRDAWQHDSLTSGGKFLLANQCYHYFYTDGHTVNLADGESVGKLVNVHGGIKNLGCREDTLWHLLMPAPFAIYGPNVIGGKAYNLDRMSIAGESIPIPSYCALTINTHRVWKSEGELPEIEAIEAFVFDAKPKWERVAVRSSANVEDASTASWAGVFHSELAVERKGFREAIERCYRAADSDRARRYAKAHNIENAPQMGLVIQEWLEPAVAGVIDTASTKYTGAMEITACEGRGEELVSGRAPADSYQVLRRGPLTGMVLEETLAKSEPVLKKSALDELFNIASYIEGLMRVPQDIEFAYSQEGKLHILQTRPIVRK